MRRGRRTRHRTTKALTSRRPISHGFEAKSAIWRIHMRNKTMTTTMTAGRHRQYLSMACPCRPSLARCSGTSRARASDSAPVRTKARSPWLASLALRHLDSLSPNLPLLLVFRPKWVGKHNHPQLRVEATPTSHLLQSLLSRHERARQACSHPALDIHSPRLVHLSLGAGAPVRITIGTQLLRCHERHPEMARHRSTPTAWYLQTAAILAVRPCRPWLRKLQRSRCSNRGADLTARRISMGSR